MKKKYNKKIAEEFCKHIASGNTVLDVCAMTGLSHESYYSWQRPEIPDKKNEGKVKNPQYHPEFVDMVKKAEAQFKLTHLSIINRAAAGTKGIRKTTKPNGDVVEEGYWIERPIWYASAWVLERKFKKEYAIRREIGGDDGKPIEVLHIYKPEKKPEGAE